MEKKTTSSNTKPEIQSSFRRAGFETKLLLVHTDGHELQTLLTRLNQSTRKEAAPTKLKGIWLEELKAAADTKSKAIKKRVLTKVQKARQATIPEEMDVCLAFWKWMGTQLVKHRSGWSKTLKGLGIKDVLGGAGNPSSAQASTGFKTPESSCFQQFN